MIRKIKDLSPQQCAVIETLLGHGIPEDGAISIVVAGGGNRLSPDQSAAIESLLERRILKNDAFIIHAIEIQPEFAIGDRVSVRVGGRNRTAHSGEIREVVWHIKDRQYNYFLREGNKKVKKRYFAEDLESASSR